MAVTIPGNLDGLRSSVARKTPEAALRWKRRGVKLYFPGSDRRGRTLKSGGAGESFRGHFATLQHAVVGPPVHRAQRGPELRRL